MYENARARAGDVKLALEARVLPVRGYGVLRVPEQHAYAQKHAQDVYNHQGDVSGQARHQQHVAHAAHAYIVVAVEVIHLPGVLSAVDKIQRGKAYQAHHQHQKLPPEKRHGYGE